MEEEALVQDVRIPACTREPTRNRGLSKAEDALSRRRIQPFGQRRLLLLTVMLEARVFSSSVSHEEEEIHEAFSGLLRLPIAGVISATVVPLHQ